MALCVALGACGRPATEEECRQILRQAARLELEERLSQSENLVKTEIQEIEKSLRPQMMEKCVGKRITESALECVRNAESSEILFDECLQ